MARIKIFSLVVISALVTLPAGCIFIQSAPVSTPTTIVHLPTETITPTPTHIPEMTIEEATLLRVDFESEYLPEIVDTHGDWQVVSEEDGNSIFCNQLSSDWSSFRFGLIDWQNYSISLKVRILSTIPDYQVETYIRITDSMEGYRATVSNGDWARIGFYPPPSSLGGESVLISSREWFEMKVQFAGEDLKFYLDDVLISETRDDSRSTGKGGFGAAPNTEVCVDDLLVWGIDQNGDPAKSSPELVIHPFSGNFYTLEEKVENKPTVPVFYPWSGSGEGIGCKADFYFDCDTRETPYSLVWIAEGLAQDLESTSPYVSDAQTVLMRSDSNTLYLISEDWHYWVPGWRTLSPDSAFFLNEVFEHHIDSEYAHTLVINFEHPDWPGVLAEKALAYKEAGFDGIIFDWWHNYAGNGRPPQQVEEARLAIAKAIREKVGDDFIVMGNVNDNTSDPTAQYLSGVFMEMWKPHSEKSYALTKTQEGSWSSFTSIERMEDLLEYWDENLHPPRIIAFEAWKITTGDFIADRYSEENYALAKLFTAMVLVIPENGYILYADNNDDWDGGDHQHAYYDFYLTDLGQPISDRVEVMEGVSYKQFEKGVVIYNRTQGEVKVTFPSGKQITVSALEGLFLEGY